MARLLLLLAVARVARALRAPAPSLRHRTMARAGGFGAAPRHQTPKKAKKAKKKSRGARAPPEACPCHSGRAYAECCGPAHADFTSVASPEALLRSRYAAFSLRLPGFLADTTHPSHRDFDADRGRRVAALSKGLAESRFTALRVVAQRPLGDDAHEITFEADIQPVTQHGAGPKAVTLFERSVFRRAAAPGSRHWLYAEGLDVNAEATKAAAPSGPTS